VLTLAAVAADKGISPQTIDVQIRRHTDSGRPWSTRFDVQIDLGEGLTRREQIILYNSARHCEVNKLLTGDLSFQYTLAE
jgi:hypothetical protein